MPSSSVSIVDIEQVKVSWVAIFLILHLLSPHWRQFINSLSPPWASVFVYTMYICADQSNKRDEEVSTAKDDGSLAPGIYSFYLPNIAQLKRGQW